MDNNYDMETDFLSVDPHQLDKEWIRQPELYFTYSKKLADAKASLDEAKNRLEVIRSELASEVRSDPDAFSIEGRVTEAAIEATVQQQAAYKSALKQLNKVKHRVDVYYAATVALDHKKKALENLVFLHGQNYFSTPRAGSVGKEAVESITKRSVRRPMKRASAD